MRTILFLCNLLMCIPMVTQKMFIYDLFLFWCGYLYLRYDNNTLIKYFENYDKKSLFFRTFT